MANIHEERLGTDSMLPLVFRMALPAVAAQLINLLYNIVDRIYIGHISGQGTEALAGIGITSSVIILIAAFSAIVGAGGAPLAAMALGRGDRECAGRFLGNGFMLLVAFSLFISILVFLFMEPLMLLAGASDHTLGYAEDYLSVYLLGTLAVQLSVGLNSFINTQGRPGVAMLSVLIGAVLNVLLDPLFIFTFGMGVKGAALATVISQFCSAVWVLNFLTSDKASLRLERKYMRPDRKILLAILTLGLSPFIMASTESLVGFVLNSNLHRFGDLYIGGLAVMQASMLAVGVPLGGFAQGFIPVASYNYGHGNKERVKACFRIGLVTMALFNFVMVMIMVLFPEVIASVFTSDRELIRVVGELMPVFLAGMTIFGIQRACQNMFVALGQAKISIFIALLRKVILLIPLVLLMSRWFGVKGVFAAESVADSVSAVICVSLFFYLFPKILKKMNRQE